RPVQAAGGALLAARVPPRPHHAKPAQRRRGARHLLAAHAGPAQPDRHLDRRASEGRRPGAVRAWPRLPRWHAADRREARPHTVPANRTRAGRRLPGWRWAGRRWREPDMTGVSRRALLAGAFAASAVTTTGGRSACAQTRSVVDSVGRRVELPVHVGRVMPA